MVLARLDLCNQRSFVFGLGLGLLQYLGQIWQSLRVVGSWSHSGCLQWADRGSCVSTELLVGSCLLAASTMALADVELHTRATEQAERLFGCALLQPATSLFGLWVSDDLTHGDFHLSPSSTLHEKTNQRRKTHPKSEPKMYLNLQGALSPRCCERSSTLILCGMVANFLSAQSADRLNIQWRTSATSCAPIPTKENEKKNGKTKGKELGKKRSSLERIEV